MTPARDFRCRELTFHPKIENADDIKIAGKSGIEEVNVNAMDGSLVGVEHESASDEKREAAAEKKAVKKP